MAEWLNMQVDFITSILNHILKPCAQNICLSEGEGTEALPTDLMFESFQDLCTQTQMAPHLETILIFGTNIYLFFFVQF